MDGAQGPTWFQWGIALCSKVKPLLAPINLSDIVVLWKPEQLSLYPDRGFVNGISNVKHCSHQHHFWFIACVPALDKATAEKSSAFHTSLLPRHSSPTGRTSGPQPDLPSPSQLPSLPPSSLLLFQDAGIRSETGAIQVNRHWLPVRVRDLLRLIMHASWSPRSQGSLPEGFHSLELKYELTVIVHSCPCKCLLT